MLDHIIVETGGVKMPLNRIALVSVLDPKTLSVNPYDPEVHYLILWSMLGICKVLSKPAL
jgi:ribosome recycling factor